MKEEKHAPIRSGALRQRAEEKSQEREFEDFSSLTPQAVSTLVHELRVHQIELELQNEDLKQAQILLDEARARYHDLYDFAPVGYLTVSKSGTVEETNFTIAALLGVSRTELRGNPLARFIVQSDAGAFREYLRQVFENGEPATCEIRMLRKDLDPSWVRLQANLCRSEETGQQFCRVTVSDIDEVRRVEEWKRRSMKLEALGTMAAGITHEFNNILFAILGNAKLLEEELGPHHPCRSYIEEIENAGTRATAVVGRILTFSRPRTSERSALPLAPIVNDSINLMRPLLPAMIEIRAEQEAGVHCAAVDPEQVLQALVNLITNACHAIGFRKGEIVVSLATIDVTQEMRREMPEISCEQVTRISVRDNGGGMSNETLERAFDPFFTTKPLTSGTGLGLWIVQGILRGHHGAVRMQSRIGEGTTCHLYFPVAALPAPKDTSPFLPEAPRTCTEHVLFVDDDDALVLLARRMLTRMGYRLTTFTNPATALAAFQENPAGFDILVTDVSMPEMSGFELARKILEIKPVFPIVITSGYISPENEETARRIGAKAFIPKPNTVDELSVELDRIFREVKAPHSNSLSTVE